MLYKRKTRIVATIGPASDTLEIQKELLRSGVNVARFNFSHGTHEEHMARIASVRRASRETEIPVALMMDTKGPEIRTGIVAGGGEITLNSGFEIVLTTEQIEGSRERLSISYSDLPSEVFPGTHIFIADGLVDLEVLDVQGMEIRCVVRNGGTFGSRKNVNVPGVRVALPAVTDKDRQDILFGIEQNLDFVAASFIRRPEDVEIIRQILKDHDSTMRIIAKIENQEGLDNIDNIIRVSNGVMVARGDLGVQLSVEQIPLVQKRIIEKCLAQGKPVITATQMLDSMIHNPNPTRAELTDVANAIFDGSDAVMLSGETAGGKYPLVSVQTMGRIIEAVEGSPEYRDRCRRLFEDLRRPNDRDIGHSVARAAVGVAREIGAAALVTPTLSGNTPRILSNYRPEQVIVAVTTSESSYRQMLLHWGIAPVLTASVSDSEMMVQSALRLAREHGYIATHDRVVTTAGIPLNSPQPMNSIRVHFLGTVLSHGSGGRGGSCSGPLVRVEDFNAVEHRLRLDGSEIMLTRYLGPDFLPLLKELKGVVLEERSSISPEQIEAAAPDLVVVAGVHDAMRRFEDGQLVTLDGTEMIIYEGFF